MAETTEASFLAITWIIAWLIAENGISLFLWIGLQVDPNWLHEVFGVQTIGQVDIEMVRCYYHSLVFQGNPFFLSSRQFDVYRQEVFSPPGTDLNVYWNWILRCQSNLLLGISGWCHLIQKYLFPVKDYAEK